MQLPENEENIVEDQPTEAVDSDADDNENQEDFSEEIEDEDTESSLENDDCRACKADKRNDSL